MTTTYDRMRDLANLAALHGTREQADRIRGETP